MKAQFALRVYPGVRRGLRAHVRSIHMAPRITHRPPLGSAKPRAGFEPRFNFTFRFLKLCSVSFCVSDVHDHRPLSLRVLYDRVRAYDHWRVQTSPLNQSQLRQLHVYSYAAVSDAHHQHKSKTASTSPAATACSPAPVPTALPTECHICLREYTGKCKVHVLPNCKHVFHSRCIGEWLRQRNLCPLCRTPVLPVPPLQGALPPPPPFPIHL